ncbi:MAG: response regulator transcription factor [Sphingomonadaceae bacterium]|nr:response regulator transcription factor [Sphingomonadaceae bacterium]
MIRVLLADDHPIILSGAEALLRGSAFEVVGKFPDGAALLAAIPELGPDIVVLDVQMSPLSGLDVLRALRARGSKLPVVLLTAAIDDRVSAEAIRLGVNGLVLKDTAPELLMRCLEEVSQGRRWIDQPVLQRMLDGPHTDGKPGSQPVLAALSQRERAVMDQVVHGLRNREIAALLGIAEGTVKVHLHKVYEKLGISSRTELVILANALA